MPDVLLIEELSGTRIMGQREHSIAQTRPCDTLSTVPTLYCRFRTVTAVLKRTNRVLLIMWSVQYWSTPTRNTRNNAPSVRWTITIIGVEHWL